MFGINTAISCLIFLRPTSILIACSVLVTMTQFFGSPIQCDAGSVYENTDGNR